MKKTTYEKMHNFEIRSEEVQKMMRKVPPAILRFGIWGVFFLLGLLFYLSFYYQMHETIIIRGFANNLSNAMCIVAPEKGTIVDITDKSFVDAGDTLFCIVSCINRDTLYISSPYGGRLYNSKTLYNGKQVIRNEMMCLVADSILDSLKVYAATSEQQLQIIVHEHKSISVQIKGTLLRGNLREIASNEKGGSCTFMVEFCLPPTLTNEVFWNSPIDLSFVIEGGSIASKLLKPYTK